MANIYCTATNTGKGFFTHEDRNDFFLAAYPGDVWVVGDNSKGSAWVSRVSGTSKTKEEAQVLVDANIATALEEWNARPAEQKAYIPEPGPRTLP